MESEECPVSLLTHVDTKILAILRMFDRARAVETAALFGPTLGDWPSWAVDAAEVLENCRATWEEALSKE